MSKKIEKMFIVGADCSAGCDCQAYSSTEELEQAFSEQAFDEDEEVLEVQVIKRYLVSSKLDLVEN